MLLNCGVGEESWESKRSNQSILEGTSLEYLLEGLMLKLKLQYFEELTHLKRPWCWERLMAGGEGDDRGWDGWMASLTQWTWVWASSRSWWWTGKPGVLLFMGLQRVRHDWVTEHQQTIKHHILVTPWRKWTRKWCKEQGSDAVRQRVKEKRLRDRELRKSASWN